MLHRVLLIALVAALVGVALWDILRRNPQLLDRLRQRGVVGSGRIPQGHRPPPRAPATKGQILELRRTPWQILGVHRGVKEEELRDAYEKLLQENSPERVCDMSAEIQELARRRTEEVKRAYEEITGG